MFKAVFALPLLAVDAAVGGAPVAHAVVLHELSVPSEVPPRTSGWPCPLRWAFQKLRRASFLIRS